jgi:hypothetical protein|tara:strand:- start:340 stop:576 length:237 start_codon:yes stop_codon:yes gene_type:complete
MAKTENIDSPTNKTSVFGLIKSKYKKGFSKIDDKVSEKILSKKDYKNYTEAKGRGDKYPMQSLEDYGSAIKNLIKKKE